MRFHRINYVLFVSILSLLIVPNAYPEPDKQLPQTIWMLEPDIESKRAAVIELEMTQDEVFGIMGKPKRKRNRKRDPEVDNVWIYYRKIN